MLYIYSGVEQLAARRAHNPKVPGSSPGPATKLQRGRYHLLLCFCRVALAENEKGCILNENIILKD